MGRVLTIWASPEENASAEQRDGSTVCGQTAGVSARSRPLRWTIASWNLHGSARPPLEAVGPAIGRLGADVVALQEVRRSQAERLAESLGMQVVWGRKHFPHTRLVPWTAEGLAVLTPHRVELVAVEVVSRTRRSWTWRRRVMIEALVERADASGYRILNLHLSPHDAPGERLEEAAKTARRISSVSAPPLVLAGDLNDGGEPDVVATLEKVGLIDAWHAAPGEAGTFTNPARQPSQTLDHVLVPAAAAHVEVGIPDGDWAAWSDHLPVVASFQLDWVGGDFAPAVQARSQ